MTMSAALRLLACMSRRSVLSSRSVGTASAPPQLQRTRRRILSGIQPTGGVPHLGNYLGALQAWAQLQEDVGETSGETSSKSSMGASSSMTGSVGASGSMTGSVGTSSSMTSGLGASASENAGKTGEVVYMVADLHALTVPQEPAALRGQICDMAASLIACGIDPRRSVLFQQSKVRGDAGGGRP